MEKKTLIKLAKDLYQKAFDANNYYSIMMQYRHFNNEYKAEMKLSPNFYWVVYDALQRASFMEIAKLYENSEEANSLSSLLQICQDNIELFPEYFATLTVRDDGIEHSVTVPFQHRLKPSEECFYKDEVEQQRAIFSLLKVPDADKIPVSIDLPFSKLLELYQKRLHSLSKKQKNIRIQRNKIYAHNDKESILEEETVWEKYPIAHSDFQELIDFALDCTRLILGTLIGDFRAETYVDDWESTLKLAQIGLECKDDYIKKQIKEVEEQPSSKPRSDYNGKL